MSAPPNVLLTLANRAENVVLVREMLVGVGEAVELDRTELEDIRTAVSEACNNAVVHAYDGGPGPFEVELTLGEHTIDVLVRDHGIGLRPRVHNAEEISVGLGLPVIGALAHSVQFSQTPRGGTEVAMQFAGACARTLQTPGTAPPIELPDQPDRALLMSIAPAGLARTVLPRVLSVLAARAHFSTDRISDIQLLADALTAHAAQTLADIPLNVGVSFAPRRLELQIGPLDPDEAQPLVLDGQPGSVGELLKRLAETHFVAHVGATRTLALRLNDTR